MSCTWTPVDKHALTSSEEIIHVKNEIKRLEELLSGVGSMAPVSQKTIQAMERKVIEYKAWVAPIRKLPVELLSAIFTECSRDNWQAPTTIEFVCRYWRRVVQDTPRAWSFISFQDPVFPPIISKYVRHGRNMPLHVWARRYYWFAPSGIEHFTERVHCLRTNLADSLLRHEYPNLNRLFLDVHCQPIGSPVMDENFLHSSRFPKLQHLSLSCEFLFCYPRIVLAPDLPLVQHLELAIGSYRPWRRIINEFSKSLRSIRLQVDDRQRDTGATDTIYMPLLEYLVVSDRRKDVWELQLGFEAPELQCYQHVADADSQRLPATDVRSIQTLLLTMSVDLTFFPRLRNVTFLRSFPPVYEVVAALHACPELCPDLSELVYTAPPEDPSQLHHAQVMLEERQGMTSRPIRFSQRNKSRMPQFVQCEVRIQ